MEIDMSQANELKTGNKSAKRAGKGATYIVTQEAFDVAFSAGVAFANAYASAAEALEPILRPLSGLSAPEAIAQWREYRRAFCMGMAAERSILPGSSERAWQRIIDDLGLDKPQSEEAKRKAAKRAADKAAEAPEADDASPKDGAGAQAAARVQMELSAMEAHLISLVRAGKAEMAAQCVAEMTAK
jgi:hypothetical protein